MTKPDSSFLDIAVRFIVQGCTKIIEIALRAVVIMFVAAVVAKRFDVFAAVGFMESLAWAAGYGLVRGVFHPKEEA